MVLQHVADCPGAVVVGAAVLYTQRLANTDLYVVDLIVAPHRLQQGIGEAQGHQVLHGFLAQVVVDAEYLVFLQHCANRFVDGGSRFQRMADRLFQHDARFGVGQAGVMQVLGNRYEQVGGGGQVEDTRQAARFAQVARQAAEVGALRSIHGEIVDPRGKPLPDLFFEVVAGDLCPAMAFGELEIIVAWQVAARQRDDPYGRVKTGLAKQVVERRKQLVQGQIAGAAEDQNVARNSQTATLHVRLTGRVGVHVV